MSKTIILGQEVEDANIADFIERLFTESETARQPMEEIWNICWNNYRGIPDKNYTHKYFIPETFTVIETILPRLTGDFLNKIDGFLAVEGRNEIDEEKAKKIEMMLNFVKDYTEWGKKFVTSIRSGLIYGTFFTHVFYEFEAHESSELMDMGGMVMEVPKTVITKDIPNFKLLSPYEVYLDPRFKNMSECEYVIHRRGESYNGLKNNKSYDQKIVDSIGRQEGSYRMDQAQREEIDTRPFTQDGESQVIEEPFEVLDFYSKDVWISVVERKYVVMNVKSPIVKKWLPIFGTNILDLHGHVYGIGLAEGMMDLQSIYNEISNLLLDNVALQTSPVTLFNGRAQIDTKKFKFVPGSKYVVNGSVPLREAYSTMVIPDVGNGARDMKNQFKMDIQNATGVNDFIRGMISQIAPSREQTATEVSEKVKQAATRFESMMMVVMDYILTLYRRFLDLLQQNFIQDDLVVRMKENDTVRFEGITPPDMEGSYDLKMSVDPLNTTDQIRRENMMRYYQITTNPLYANMGIVDYASLIADMAKELDLKKDYINPEFGQMVQMWNAVKSGQAVVMPNPQMLMGGQGGEMSNGQQNGNQGVGGEEGFSGMMQNQMMPSVNSV